MEQLPQKGAKIDKNSESRQERNNKEAEPPRQKSSTIVPCHPGRVGPCQVARSCPHAAVRLRNSI